jgi:hypothetical protein
MVLLNSHKLYYSTVVHKSKADSSLARTEVSLLMRKLAWTGLHAYWLCVLGSLGFGFGLHFSKSPWIRLPFEEKYSFPNFFWAICFRCLGHELVGKLGSGNFGTCMDYGLIGAKVCWMKSNLLCTLGVRE